jgi:hypothetical protein
MTIREVVSLLRDSLKEQSTDTKYTNRFLWSTFLRGRNTLLKQEADSKKKLFNLSGIWDTVCVQMQEVSSLICNCDCLPYDCYVYRSKKKLPKSVESSLGILYRYIATPDLSVDITLVSPTQYQIKSKIKGNKLKYAFIHDGYLYTPGLKYPTIVVSAVFDEDVSTLNCNKSINSDNPSTTNTCSSILDRNTGLPDYLEDAGIKMALQLLIPSKQILADDLPNMSAQPTI